MQRKLNTHNEIIKYLEDIGQCYETILTTRKGTVVHNPNLGTDIKAAIGEDYENAFKIAKAIILKELPIQEPRGKVLDVQTSFNTNGQIILNIEYKMIDDESDLSNVKEIIL